MKHSLTARGLTIWYVLALSLLAILSVGSHLLVADVLKKNEGSAAIINMSGRQRMLSQRITANALRLQSRDDGARASLYEAIDQFSDAHDRLVEIAASPATDAKLAGRLRALYFEPGTLDAQVRRFVAAAEHLVSRSGPEAERESAELNTLVVLSRGTMLQGLERVVSEHQQYSDAMISRLKTVQDWILVVLLITLLGEALFIYRPMMQRLLAHMAKLRELADYDYLTGVANRRAFTRNAAGEIERSRRHGHDLSVLIIDADHFKRVNDTHGHLFGDAVLVSLARLMGDAGRVEDQVGRIGGEEFAVLLPQTSLALAISVADRIRQAIAQSTVEAFGTRENVTVSIGCASVPLSAEKPLEEALMLADKMLYLAKEAGRNRVWPKLELAHGQDGSIEQGARAAVS